MWQNFKWLVENFLNILLMVLVTLFCLGGAIELVARFIPTKKPDSIISQLGLRLGRFGHGLVLLGDKIKTLLDFVKIPNRLK